MTHVMPRRLLVTTHTEGAARASRGHGRLGGVQPLRALGLEEVVDDGVEEGAYARSGVPVRTHAGAGCQSGPMQGQRSGGAAGATAAGARLA